MMTNGDPEGRIFLFHPQTNNGFVSCSPLIPHFILKDHEKDFQEVLDTLRCDTVTSI